MGVIYDYEYLIHHGLPSAKTLHHVALELVAACDRMPYVSAAVVVGSVGRGRHDRWSDIDAIIWATEPVACVELLGPTLETLIPSEALEVKVWPAEESFESRAERYSDLGFALAIMDGFEVGELHVGHPDIHTRTLADRYRASPALRRRCVANYLERRRSIADGIVQGTVTWSLHEARRLCETPKAVQRQVSRLADDLAVELAVLEHAAFQELAERWSIVVGLQERTAQGAVTLEEYERALLGMALQSAQASSRICTRALKLVHT